MKHIISTVVFSLAMIFSESLICDPVELKNVMGIRQITQSLPTPIFDCGSTGPIAINQSGTFALTQDITCDITISTSATLLLNGYTVEGTITVSSSNVTIDLQGGWIIPNSNELAAIEIYNGFNDITIQNGNITANAYGILTDGTNQNIVVKKINIQDSGSYSGSVGLSFEGVAGGLIDSCIAQANSYTGILVDSSSNINIIGYSIIGIDAVVSPTAYGLYINNSQNICIADGSIKGTLGNYAFGLSIESSNQCTISNCDVLDTQGTTSAVGIALIGNNDITVDKCNIINTQIYNFDNIISVGLLIQGNPTLDPSSYNSDVRIKNCNIQDTYAYSGSYEEAQACGIYATYYTNCQFIDNIINNIYSNTNTESALSYGIYNTSVQNFVFIHNTISTSFAYDRGNEDRGTPLTARYIDSNSDITNDTRSLVIGVQAHGIYNTDAQNCVFMGNNISNISTIDEDGTSTTAAFYVDPQCSTLTIDGNEFSNVQGSSHGAPSFLQSYGLYACMGDAPYNHMVLRNYAYNCGETPGQQPANYQDFYNCSNNAAGPFPYTQGAQYYNATNSIPSYFAAFNVDGTVVDYNSNL